MNEGQWHKDDQHQKRDEDMAWNNSNSFYIIILGSFYIIDKLVRLKLNPFDSYCWVKINMCQYFIGFEIHISICDGKINEGLKWKKEKVEDINNK